MAKVGKLSAVRVNHVALGQIIEVEVPTACTSLNDVDNLEDLITVRLTYETAAKLATLLNKLVEKQAEVVRDSFCGAI